MMRQFISLSAIGLLAITGTASAAPVNHERSGENASAVRARPAAARPAYGGYRGGYRPYYGYGRGYGYGYRPYYGYGRGWGYGAGFATGVGFGYLFSPGGYGGIPFSGRGGYYSNGGAGYGSSYNAIPAYGDNAFDDPNMYPPQMTGSESGLQITEVMDGPAKQGRLQVGDIILGIGQTRTQTFDELQRALTATRGQAEVVFINHENKNVERLPITPVDNKLGIAVVPVSVR